MTRIFLATCEKLPNLTNDDLALVAPLSSLAIEARPAIWSDPKIDWSGADAIVLRSTWDYHLRLGEFLAWIGSLEKVGTRVFNPPDMLRWNTSKIYLRDLEEKGVPIVPTFWPEEDFDLAQELEKRSWPRAVIKPRVSATAYQTLLTKPENSLCAQNLADKLLRGPGLMVQKFVEEVQSEGEWSSMFFAGKFSHAVLKTPKSGDFRSQEEFGGNIRNLRPADALLPAAQKVISTLNAIPLYARVDGVVSGGRFLLMELELIEPALYLYSAEGAAERFATAIAAKLS